MTEGVKGEVGMTDRRFIEDDISGRPVMGRGVVEIDGVCHGVRVVKADLREDLTVVLRIDVVRGPDVSEIELAGPLHSIPGGESFESSLANGRIVRLRPLVATDAAWLLDAPIEGLTSDELTRALGAYDLAAGVDGDRGPWEGGDEPVEVVTLELDADDDHAVALCYSVCSPWHEDAGPDSRLDVWRIDGRWRPEGPRDAAGESWIVDPGMLGVVLEAFDEHRVIPKLAAVLGSWDPESTLVGMDPFAGRIRRTIDPDIDGGVRALLARASEAGITSADVEYLRNVIDVEFQLNNLDSAQMAWPEQVFGSVTRLATDLAQEGREPFEFAFALVSMVSPGVAAFIAVSVPGRRPVRVEIFPQLSPAGWEVMRNCMREVGEFRLADDADPAVDLDLLEAARQKMSIEVARGLSAPESGPHAWLSVNPRDAELEAWDVVQERLVGNGFSHFNWTIFSFVPLGEIDFDRFVATHRRSLPTKAEWEALLREMAADRD